MNPLRSQVLAALRDVHDPETGLDVVELGLIYDVLVQEPASVVVRMTLTTPSCPVSGPMVDGVRRRAEAVPGVAAASVDLTFDPPWTPDRIGPAGRVMLGW